MSVYAESESLIQLDKEASEPVSIGDQVEVIRYLRAVPRKRRLREILFNRRNEEYPSVSPKWARGFIEVLHGTVTLTPLKVQERLQESENADSEIRKGTVTVPYYHLENVKLVLDDDQPCDNKPYANLILDPETQLFTIRRYIEPDALLS